MTLAHRWTAAVALVSSPFLVVLCLILWRTPFPLTEAVAIFEDVERADPVELFVPDTSYYRPLYYLTTYAIWHSGASLDARLASITLIQIAAVALLVILLIWHLRPRGMLEVRHRTSPAPQPRLGGLPFCRSSLVMMTDSTV